MRKFFLSTLLYLVLSMPISADETKWNSSVPTRWPTPIPISHFEKLRISYKPDFTKKEAYKEGFYGIETILNEAIFSVQMPLTSEISAYPGILIEYNKDNNTFFQPRLSIGIENHLSLGIYLGKEFDKKERKKGVFGFGFELKF